MNPLFVILFYLLHSIQISLLKLSSLESQAETEKAYQFSQNPHHMDGYIYIYINRERLEDGERERGSERLKSAKSLNLSE